MKININDIVSISTFIYYYTCFLAIEVTGLLSYALYKFSINKEERDVFERKRSRKLNHIKKINQINDELRENYNAYIKERGSSKWSFYAEIETNHLRKQYGYGIYGEEFKVEKWNELKADLYIVLNELKNPSLMSKFEYVYEGIKELINHQDKDQLDLLKFKDLKQNFNEILTENQKIINYMSI